MKKYIRSFRIFVVPSSILYMVIALAVGIMIFFALCIAETRYYDEETGAFIGRFLEGYLPFFSIFVPMLGVGMLNVVYNSNLPANAGYRFFHSLPDAAESFRQAIAAGNAVVLLIGLVCFGVVCFFNFTLALFLLSFTLLIIGMMNMFGHAKSLSARLVMVFIIGMFAGFFFSFTFEDDFSYDMLMEVIITVVSVIIFAVGIIYSFSVAKKKWIREV